LGRGRTPASIDHRIDELEDGAPIGGWEFFDAADPFQEPCGLGLSVSRIGLTPSRAAPPP
jgi:hypothetical protein